MSEQILTINLTNDKVEALCNMYNCIEENLESTIQSVLNNQADNYILERVKEEENKLDIETRKSNLGSSFSITPSE